MKTREEWLEIAIKRLIPIFTEVGLVLPKDISVYCDRKGDLEAFGLTKGMCWTDIGCNPKDAIIWVSHFLRCVRGKHGILAVLVHELVHAITGFSRGHGVMFRHAMHKVGLRGEARCAHAGKKLCIRLESIANKLGPIPSSRLLVKK